MSVDTTKYPVHDPSRKAWLYRRVCAVWYGALHVPERGHALGMKLWAPF